MGLCPAHYQQWLRDRRHDEHRRPGLREQTYEVVGDWAWVDLANGRGRAKVDLDDLERVLEHRWSLHEKQPGSSVVYAKSATAGGRMHWFIMGGKGVDHVNGDGLDNRKANLRWATPQENAWNSRGRNRYKGVSWHKGAGKWRAYITVNGEREHLGFFVDPEEAARAVDTRARDLHGGFARPNL